MERGGGGEALNVCFVVRLCSVTARFVYVDRPVTNKVYSFHLCWLSIWWQTATRRRPLPASASLLIDLDR